MTPRTSAAARGKPAEPRREALLTDFSVTPTTPQERRRAALAVCDRAGGAAEAHELLEALGLLDRALRSAA
jgi:hypothetical protein